MGKRYQAILKYLDQEHLCWDIKHDEHTWEIPSDRKFLDKADNFIIASPTPTHLAWVRQLDSLGKPILCEKPLSTNLEEVREILDCKSPLSMMAQYQHLVKSIYPDGDESTYNYFRHGNDGLKWDCFQIIAMADGPVSLGDTSPIWECKINGHEVVPSSMDRAYVIAVGYFLEGHYLDRATLLNWHKKVEQFAI